MDAIDQLIEAKRKASVPASGAQALTATVPTGGAPLDPIDVAIEAKRGQQPSVGEDIRNVAPRALRTGVEMIPAGPSETSEFVPWITRLALARLNKMGLVVGGDETLKEFDQSTGANLTMPGSLDQVRSVTDPILGKGEDVEPQTSVGGYVQTGLENVGTLLNPGSATSKGLQWLGSSGLSEGAGQVAEQMGADEGKETLARLIGGIAGGATPQAFNKVSNPRPIPPTRQPHIDVLKSRNVPISAGQETGDKKLMFREEQAGGTKAQDEQGEAFTAAALGEQGGFPKGTRTASREAMKTELKRMGTEFDRLQAKAAVPFDQSLMDDLTDIVGEYKLDTPLAAGRVEEVVNRLFDNAMANNQTLNGKALQDTRSKIGDVIRETDDDSLRGALIDIQDRLDEAVQNSLPPEDQGAYRTVRAQYRNYLPIENAKASRGQQASEGTISPSGLRTGVKAVEGKREVASGSRSMTELAEAGNAILEKMPNSGTQQRMRAMLAGLMPAATGAASGGLASLLGQDPLTSAAIGGTALLGSSVYPAARDALLTSDIGQAWARRQGPRIDTQPAPKVIGAKAPGQGALGLEAALLERLMQGQDRRER